MGTVAPFMHLCRVGAALWVDLVRFLGTSLRSRTALAAENLFLRKQLALYRERQAGGVTERTLLRSTIEFDKDTRDRPRPLET
jgi:hypothetical protein